MHRREILGSLVLAWSWLFAYPVYDRPVPWLAWALAAVGVILVATAPPVVRVTNVGRRRWWPAALNLAAALLLPWPFGLPFVALALAAALAPGSSGGLHRVGTITAVQAGVLALLLIPGGARAADLGFLHAPVGALLRLVGLMTIDSGDALWVDHGGRHREISTTLDNTGLAVAILMLAAPALLHRGSLRSLLALTAALVCYSLVRFCGLVVWSLEADSAALLCDPLTLAATFAPFALVAARTGCADPAAPAEVATWHRFVLPIGVLAGVAMLLPFASGDGHEQRGSRVLVDDAHGPWEQGSDLATLDDFGTDSVYNYSALWDWTGRHYPTRIHREGRLTAELLRGCETLVLKMPSYSYDAAERQAISEFVHAGGGLWAIGDHTDVFGTTSVLNEVLDPFGVRLESDVASLATKRAIGNYRYRVCPLVGNPLTRYVREGLDLMGPATIRVTAGRAEHFMAAMPQVLDAVDYRDGSFFGDVEATLDDRVGPFMFCVAKRVGRGRLVVWSDSTVFSNFGLFEPGKAEVVRGILEYLDRSAAADALSDAMAALWPWLLLGAAWLLTILPPPIVAAALSGIALGIGAMGLWSRVRLERLPQWTPTVPFTTIGFEGRLGHCGIDYPRPDEHAVEQDSRSVEYSGMFAAILRQRDRFPKVVESEADLRGVDVLLIVDPHGAMEDDWLRAIEARVAEGMQVVVVDSALHEDSLANRILERFGMRLGTRWDRGLANTLADRGPHSLAGGDAALLTILDAALRLADWRNVELPGEELSMRGAPVFAVEGGQPVWTVGSQAIPVLAVARYGTGRAFAYSGGAGFSIAELGLLGDDLLPQDPQVDAYRRLAALIDFAHPASARPAVVAAAAGAAVDEPGIGASKGAAPAPEGASQSDLPTAREVFADLQRERAGTSGARRAPVWCVVRDGEKAAFVAGVAASDARRSVVRMTGAKAGVSGGNLAIEEFRCEPDALLWARNGYHLVLRMPLRDGAGPGDPFSVPMSWAERRWDVRASSLERELGREDADELSGLRQLAQDFTGRCDASGFFAPGWSAVRADDECLVLRSGERAPIAGGWLGQIELVVQRRPMMVRRLLVSLRHRGSANEMSWLDVMIEAGGMATSPSVLDLPEIPPDRVVEARGLRLQHLQGR